MKITVRITGILEAEAELVDVESGDIHSPDWLRWHSEQHLRAKEFIATCADQAIRVAQGMPREVDAPSITVKPILP